MPLQFKSLRPHVHTNPSRQWSFSKTLFNPEAFENAGVSFSCGRKTFQLKRNFSKTMTSRQSRDFPDRVFLKHKVKVIGDCYVFKFLRHCLTTEPKYPEQRLVVAFCWVVVALIRGAKILTHSWSPLLHQYCLGNDVNRGNKIEHVRAVAELEVWVCWGVSSTSHVNIMIDEGKMELATGILTFIWSPSCNWSL